MIVARLVDIRADGADDGRTEVLGPLQRQQPDAAGRRVMALQLDGTPVDLVNLTEGCAEGAEACEITDTVYISPYSDTRCAGGVVIGPSKLTDFTPLFCEPGGGSMVTQFDMKDVEKVGLVKFDFLGLRTLTIIDWALKTINAGRVAAGEEPIVLEKLPMDDPEAFLPLVFDALPPQRGADAVDPRT